MTSVRAFVGLGSNLDDPRRHVSDALAAIDAIPRTRCVARSRLYRSTPLGSPEQPDYVNALAAVETRLDPHELLDQLFVMENAHGRVRGPVRWGPRTLDLDLLLYGDVIMRSERLILPHPGLYERNFVLLPLYEIAPDLVLPDGRPLSVLAESCLKEGIGPLLS